MIEWFEKRDKLSLTITAFLAVTIFYLSTISFKASSKSGLGIRSIIYHITMYFIFNLFLTISLSRGKNRFLILVSALIAFFYGITDELHQSFVPMRSASVNDLFLDSLGIIYACLVYLISIEKRNKRDS